MSAHHADSVNKYYLDNFRQLANMLFALCMFASVLNIDFVDDRMAEPDLLALMQSNLNSVMNFIVAFVFLAMYWVKFVGKMKFMVRSNAIMLVLWLGYLAVVCLYPFAENLLGNYPGSAVAQVFFSALWAVIGILAYLNWWYAVRTNLIDPTMPALESRRMLAESFPEPLIAVLSIPVAFVSDVGYYLVMLMIVPANIWIAKKYSSKNGSTQAKSHA